MGACVIALVGCGGGEASSDGAHDKAADGSKAVVIDGRFDVGGHKLYLHCQGGGSPTVVYLHGSIEHADGGGENAGSIPSLLAKHHRACVYDRANVERSDAVPGPLTGLSSVKDLHRLLAVAKVPGPYVLLGASYGGLIADMYAATYPDDIRGMVLLDPALPGDLRVDRLLRADERIRPDDWKHQTEQLDQLVTFRQALRLVGKEPQVPLAFFVTKKLELARGEPRKREITRTVRAIQHAFVDRFAQARLITVNGRHYMEPAHPEAIAAETEKVITAGG